MRIWVAHGIGALTTIAAINILVPDLWLKYMYISIEYVTRS